MVKSEGEMRRIGLSKLISWQRLDEAEFAFVYSIKTHKYFRLENVELAVWDYLTKEETVTSQELVSFISKEYQIAESEINSDIEAFLASLVHEGVVEER